MGLTAGLRSLSALCILAFLIILGGCAHQAQPPVPKSAALLPGLEEGTLLVANGTATPLLTNTASFVERARNADFILIGEGHTVPCDHLMQARLMQALSDSGQRFTVGLEMFPIDHQPLLDKVNAGSVPLDQFANATDWKKAWGYDSDLYRPVFETVYARKLPLRALNVPQTIVKKVSRGGISSLAPEERALLPAKIIPASDAQREALQEMFDAHRAMVNGTMTKVAGMMKGQKPAAMAGKTPSVPAPERSPDQTPDQTLKQAPQSADSQPSDMNVTGVQGSGSQPSDTQASGTRPSDILASGTLPAGMQQSVTQPSGDQSAQAASPAPKDKMTGRMDRFFLIQSLWDTAMAEQAIKAKDETGNPVVVLIGSGHVEFGWGMAHRIRKLHPESRVLLVTPWRGTEPLDPLEADMQYYCRLTHQSRMGFSLLQVDGGAQVLDVLPGSRAAKAGFMKGDIITAANGTAVDSMWVLHTAGLEAAKAGKDLVFTVLRGTVQTELVMPVGKTEESSPPQAPAAN
ncbi:ChaN family lipoprotein [Desulfovibrio subterraneus]|uniref:PDZ domain-containing protein n=1 Tax=Desulfovibrio subterraneus TaxID=2718620 RepID=A0A7J0BFH9_9BACT|nr:ChaN family lipoprotein [Desulfovibrio subterraneus]GFM32298.1 PDZ domain-containing protein [Desulfovibrio subterraneus]